MIKTLWISKNKRGNKFSPVFPAEHVKLVRRPMKTKKSKTGIMVYSNPFSNPGETGTNGSTT